MALTVSPFLYCIISTFIGALFRFLDRVTELLSRSIYGTSLVNICSPHFRLEDYQLNFIEDFKTPPSLLVDGKQDKKSFDHPDPYAVPAAAGAATGATAGADDGQRNRIQVTKLDIACAFLSQLAYETPEKQKELFNKWVHENKLPPYFGNDLCKVDFSYRSIHDNFKSFISNGRFDTQAYVLHVSPRTLVIAFRGSDPFELTDWFTDASIVQHRLIYSSDPVLVHRGFASALGLDIRAGEDKPPRGNIVGQIVDYILKLWEKFPEINSIYITGHSLGGALAQQFAYAVKSPSPFIKLWHQKIQSVGALVKGVYTYGTPRSGNQAFVDEFNELYRNIVVHRIVYNDDIVARMPISRMRLQWDGQLYHFQYSATKGLIYIIAPTSADPDYYRKERATPLEKYVASLNPELSAIYSTSAAWPNPGHLPFIAPPSAIPERPDDRLGFAIGWSSFINHSAHVYCNALYTIWWNAAKKA